MKYVTYQLHQMPGFTAVARSRESTVLKRKVYEGSAMRAVRSLGGDAKAKVQFLQFWRPFLELTEGNLFHACQQNYDKKDLDEANKKVVTRSSLSPCVREEWTILFVAPTTEMEMSGQDWDRSLRLDFPCPLLDSKSPYQGDKLQQARGDGVDALWAEEMERDRMKVVKSLKFLGEAEFRLIVTRWMHLFTHHVLKHVPTQRDADGGPVWKSVKRLHFLVGMEHLMATFISTGGDAWTHRRLLNAGRTVWSSLRPEGASRAMLNTPQVLLMDINFRHGTVSERKLVAKANLSKIQLVRALNAPQTRSVSEASQGTKYVLVDFSVASKEQMNDPDWVSSLIRRSLVSFVYERFRAQKVVVGGDHFVQFCDEYTNPLNRFGVPKNPTFVPNVALLKRLGSDPSNGAAASLYPSGVVSGRYPMRGPRQLGEYFEKSAENYTRAVREMGEKVRGGRDRSTASRNALGLRAGTIPYLHILKQVLHGKPQRFLNRVWPSLFSYFRTNGWDLFPTTDEGKPWKFEGVGKQRATPKLVFYHTSPPPSRRPPPAQGGEGKVLQRPVRVEEEEEEEGEGGKSTLRRSMRLKKKRSRKK